MIHQQPRTCLLASILAATGSTQATHDRLAPSYLAACDAARTNRDRILLQPMQDWARSHLRGVAARLMVCLFSGTSEEWTIPTGHPEQPFPDGATGVLSITWGDQTHFHAVAVVNGRISDPGDPELLLTWQDYVAWWRHNQGSEEPIPKDFQPVTEPN